MSEEFHPLRVFVDELVRAGVRDAVICPGSRSTPLALALRAHTGLRCLVLPDERAAGFFAIGLARASGRAVAVLCTSGTATLNLAPAVTEALQGRVPLIVLTADRPPELRDRAAAQTIDQIQLFGTHVKWYSEVPVLDAAPELIAHARSLAGRAVATALTTPRGPVHLNLALREPLIPTLPLGPIPGEQPAFTTAMVGKRKLGAGELGALAGLVRATERGLIVAGPQDDPALAPALARLAAATGYPILADPLSQVRVGPHDREHVVARGDLLVRPGRWIAAHGPQLVIRFGAMPTSKPILKLLRDTAPTQLVVDGAAGWRESALIRTTHIHADEVGFADSLAEALAGSPPAVLSPDSTWTADWLTADRKASEALADWLAGPALASEPFEPRPFVLLADLLPDGAILWAGNSMPVRDMDTYLAAGPKAIRCFANRGANGIDGVVSTALGAAAATDGGPVVLVVGDLSFLHDLNALVAARLHHLDATIVLTNNDGGGIFSFLPQGSTNDPGVGLPDAYEELFGTPHGTDFGPIVVGLGATHAVVEPEGLRAALEASIGAPGVQVLEVRTDRARNVALHREAAAAVACALDELA
jgi:2-succinyl-5-enolpyruvyl-6-hydroxy-3-cyclohexene-1-carboxylate synthase